MTSNYRSYGQNETLISSIRNIIKDYPFESIFKEFLQNADDAGAKRVHIIVDGRSHSTNSLLCDGMKEWQGPAILIFNDAIFKESDFDSLMRIRVGGKQDDDTKIGKHGLGFNSCYHFTDVPSFISGDSIAFMDPQEKFLPERNNLPQRGIIGPFPKNGIRDFSERDQFVPYEGIEGIDFRSTFNGTLFRIPLRQRPSEISDRIFSVKEVLELFIKIKSNVTSQFLFLRNIEKIEVSQVSCISNATSFFQIDSLWKATVNGLDEDMQSKRKHIVNGDVRIFQMEIELIDNMNNVQNDQWIIATGAQPDPDDSELQKYAKRYRLRVLGGVAALLKSKKYNKSRIQNDPKEGTSNKRLRLSKKISTTKSHTHLLQQQNLPASGIGNLNIPNLPNFQENEKLSDFKGRLFSTFPLPDTTCLPVHLNGTWAQGSDRARLLIEKDNDLPDMDHQKLNWNRHILLEFLPDLHCKLLEEIIKLQNYKKIDFKNCISKFWPFPLSTHNYPKYVFSYGTKKEPLKLMIRKLPIWPVRWNPSMENCLLSYAPVSIGYVLPKDFQMYRTKSEKIFLRTDDHVDNKILKDLDVTQYEIHDYAFNDVELPEKSDPNYVNFLDSVLNNATSDYGCKITKDLKKLKFPNAFTDDLLPISDLFNYNNIVFRTVFGGNSNVFLHFNLIKHKNKLSNIGFNDELESEAFDRCALKIEELQEMGSPPSDIRHRGFILVDYFYKDVMGYFYKEIDRIPFVPITKCLDKPYDKYYNQPQFLDCFNNIIHPQYKGVAWSQKALIAEDVIPPPDVLEIYPSLGKPSDVTVIKHLKFLRNKLIDDDEWRNDWKETFVSNVFEVYDWLEEKCSNENLRLNEYIKAHEPLFLNLGKSQNPFDTDNWVSASNLILNAEPGEDKYINPRLAKSYAMLKSAGVKEIKAPSVKIQVREHDQSSINKKVLLENLSNQVNSLHDVVFNVNGENIWASRSVLAASSKFFHQKFTPGGEYVNSNPVTIDVNDVSPTSVRILLHYLYGQNIDNAIWSYHQNTTDQTLNFETYEELLLLANEYKLDHLKELMELKLSRMVNRSNVNDIKDLAEDLNASQLKVYCDSYIDENM
ncbi:5807_t:CDS:2 [Diversispora eburnea]|uniref:5807_t:CDS:1 n=1 Tax=Diversispora eburnea TaxID=1213867 RepID=A0A9N9FZR6_9GLOM|nr:5807_t:CDS:2 [Diversispora eburnea]